MIGTTTMERTGMALPGVSYPSYGQQAYTSPAFGPMPGVSYFNVPRCTFKVERTTDGFKVHCVCDDQAACSVMQSLCSALTGGACCCCVTYNGMTVCNYNFTMGLCRCETVDRGVCFSCTSGDPKCCTSLQTWCDCLSAMIAAGCYCTFHINNTPVCCGCCETTSNKTTPAKR